MSQPTSDLQAYAAHDRGEEWPDAKFFNWLAVRRHRFWLWLHTSGPADWLLVLVGFWGVKAALDNLKTVSQQARAADKSFELAQHAQRAWISLETLHLDYFEWGAAERDPKIQGEKVKVPRAVVGLRNSGQSPPFIDRAKVLLMIGDTYDASLPEIPPYDNAAWDNAPPSLLVAGEITNWRHWFLKHRISIADFDAIQNGTKKMWVFGRVEFHDAFGVAHLYGFAREYDGTLANKPPGARFAHVHNPSYSYAD